MLTTRKCISPAAHFDSRLDIWNHMKNGPATKTRSKNQLASKVRHDKFDMSHALGAMQTILNKGRSIITSNHALFASQCSAQRCLQACIHAYAHNASLHVEAHMHVPSKESCACNDVQKQSMHDWEGLQRH